MLFNSPTWKKNLPVSSVLANISPKSTMSSQVTLPGSSPSLGAITGKAEDADVKQERSFGESGANVQYI